MAERSLKFLLLAMLSAWPATALHARDPGKAGGDAQEEAGQPGEYRQEIVVTGWRMRRPILGDVRPETQYDAREIEALGAASVEELLNAISLQTRGSAGSGPIVLLNGRRISGFSEVSSLPPEAVERVDVLPEEVALKYGYGPGNRVVNIVLLPRFRATTAEVERSSATEGGRSTGRGDLNVVRVKGTTRWSLGAQYRREGGLLESERRLVPPSADDQDFADAAKYRSLLPEKERFSLAGTLSGFVFGDVSGTLNLAGETSETISLFGLRDTATAGPLTRRIRYRSEHAGVALGGALASWLWSFTGSYARARSSSITDAPSVEFARDRSRWSSGTGNAELLAYGDLARLPAGPLSTSLTLAVQSIDFTSSGPGAGEPALSHLTRRRASLQASFDLPIAGPAARTPKLAGSLSANFTLALSRLSDFGTIRRIGYGLNWTPLRPISVTASFTDEERAPSVEQLGDPATLTPNVRVLDLSRGDTVEIARLDGGNRDLLAGKRRLLKLAISLRPIPTQDVSLRVDYLRTRDRDVAAAFPGYTTELEAVVPERFVRDSEGRLLRIDYRPVNFARADREELRWGLSASLPVYGGKGAERSRKGVFDLSLLHSWFLRDQALLRKGLPRLDFLNGSAAGAAGARPRHQMELQAGLYRAGIGARLGANLQSGSFIGRGGATARGGDLRFGSLATANLRLFADLGRRPGLLRRLPWVNNARLSVGVTNVFNARPRVRDRHGNTPWAYQAAYLDPVGRAATISLRKLFS